MKSKEEFAVWLRKQLSIKNLTVSDLARLSRIDKSEVSRNLNGLRSPTVRCLNAYADALELPTEVVYNEAGYTPPKQPSLYVEVIRIAKLLDNNSQKSLLKYAKNIYKSQEKRNGK